MKVEVNKEDVIKALKQCYDPEIPINIYDLGLIYKLDIDGDKVNILMTLTSPFCPVTDYLIEDIKGKIRDIAGANEVNIDITFDPPWSLDKMSEKAKEQLGLI